MGSAKRKLEKLYVKNLSNPITDPIVKNRGRISTHVSIRAEKGGKTVRRLVSKVFGGKKR